MTHQSQAETPHPSPVDYTEVVERLRADPYYDRKPLDYGLMHEAAQVIEAQAAENERKRQIIDTWHTSFLVAEERRLAAQARIAELEKERDEANGCLLELKRHLKAEGCTYREDEEGAPYVVNTRAATAESRLADAVKVIEAIANIPNGDDPGGLGIQRNAMLAAARSFLSTGGDSHG